MPAKAMVAKGEAAGPVVAKVATAVVLAKAAMDTVDRAARVAAAGECPPIRSQ